MRYFILENPRNCSKLPDVVNWYSIIDVRNILREKAYLLPRRELLYIRSATDLIWADVICKPFLLLSEMIHDVLIKYEPKTLFRQIILLDEKNAESGTYFLPILEQIDCLHESSELNLDKSVIKKAVLDLSKVGDASFFWIKTVKSTYTVARLDFVESILRRGAQGISLIPLECITRGNRNGQ